MAAKLWSMLSNHRSERVANDAVTFRYTDGKTGAKKGTTLPIDACISRLLAHVLPEGLVKVRSYGLLHLSKRQLLTQARSVVTLRQAAPELPVRAAAAPEPLRGERRAEPGHGRVYFPYGRGARRFVQRGLMAREAAP